jgi:hypothetical protein
MELLSKAVPITMLALVVSSLALATRQRNIAAALVGGKNFDDPKLLFTVVVIAIVGLLTLMPLARVLGMRCAGTRAWNDISSGPQSVPVLK